MTTPSSIQQLDIDDLKPGMYVSELDIPLIRIPFFRHRRLISNNNDIKLLKSAGVKKVSIDLSKSRNDEQPETAATPTKRTMEATIALKEELKTAAEIECQAIAEISHAHEQLNTGEQIDIASFNPLISKTLDSLGRNNKALLALLNKSQENDNLVAHHFRVLSLTSAIAVKMGFDDRRIEHLALASILHDAGWVKLPTQLIAKGKKYKPAERKLVEQHIPILKNTLFQEDLIPKEVLTIIEQHHERGDGSGYPKKLTLYEIDPAARLLALCDYYDELTHGLGESAGILPKKALGLLYKEADLGRFEQNMVSELIHLMGVYPIGSAVLLNTGEKAVIIDHNDDEPLNPIIKIAYNKIGQPLAEMPTVNLAKQKRSEPNRSVQSILDPSKDGSDPKGIMIWSSEIIE